MDVHQHMSQNLKDAAVQLAQVRLTRWQLEQFDALGGVYKRWAAKHFIAGSGTARWTHLLCSLCTCHSLLLGSWLLWRQSPE